jgi:arsenite methyltransferase
MFICKRCCCSVKKTSCCSPEKLRALSSDLTVISVRTRLVILYLLKDKPHCVCDIGSHTGMSQSLISHHLADLENAKLISCKREGKFVDYFLTEKGGRVVKALDLLLSSKYYQTFIGVSMDTAQIKTTVKDHYGDIAKKSGSCCCKCSCVPAQPSAYAKKIGYKNKDMISVPEGANLGLGCGNPTAIDTLKTGEWVLDLGSGAGFDAFLAAKAVGETGKVFGVDMTPEMVEKANENIRKGDYANVEFKLGEIEDLPIESNTINAVISNCVINLSPDKVQVFKEAYRVLKTGGRLMVSDIVLEQPLPDSVRENLTVYVGCISGAILQESYLGAMEKAGFKDIRIVASAEWLTDFVYANDRLSLNEEGKALLATLGGDEALVSKLAKSVKSIQIIAWKK